MALLTHLRNRGEDQCESTSRLALMRFDASSYRCYHARHPTKSISERLGLVRIRSG